MAWRLPPCACQADQANFAEAQLNNPLATDAMHALAAPSAAHWCGTDAVGRDISSRIIAATRPITSSRLRAALMTDPNTCRFYGRCPKGQNNCAAMMPELRAFDAGRSVACHFPEVVVRAETATAA